MMMKSFTILLSDMKSKQNLDNRVRRILLDMYQLTHMQHMIRAAQQWFFGSNERFQVVLESHSFYLCAQMSLPAPNPQRWSKLEQSCESET